MAIDGPAGSGKSTTARMVAAKLNYSFLDTGAMYRAVTHFALTNSIDPSDGNALALISEKLDIRFETDEEINRVFIGDEEITEQIRTPEVTKTVSEISAHLGVRQAMVVKQQKIGKNGSVVAEGRDTTTVVFPDADVKIFLNASVKQRAQRRLIELAKAGVSTSIEEQIADLERRDEYDSGRKHSPLKKAKDAYVIDTSECTIEEQVERVLTIFKSVFS